MKKETLNFKQDEDILYKTKILSKKMRACFDKKLLEFDLTAQQGRALCYICQNKAQSKETHQNDIEKCFELSKSTVSGLIDRLEKKDLIKRIPAGACTKIVPTAKGHDVIELINKGRNETMTKLLNGFNEDEQSEIFNIITKLLENLKEEE